MAKLFTHEDRFNVHKGLGLLCLVNYVYRIFVAFSGRPTAHVPVWWVLAHSALSLTGLFFNVPSNRVAKRPMIYREFRAHSILFALRSSLVMLCMRYFPGMAWPRAVVVLATIAGADLVTAVYRPDNTTMRGMPFPEGTPGPVKNTMNTFYSVSQVLATMNMLFTEKPYVPLLVMFPIQLAALLMTLVRKGYLGAFGWHLLYSAALALNYVHAASTTGVFDSWDYIRIASLFCILRFEFSVNKYVLWCTVCAIAMNR